MKDYKKVRDIGKRDAPVIFYSGFLYIGNYLDTHTILLNKILGLDLEVSSIDEALEVNWSDDITKTEEFEGRILFGNLYEKTIYWEWFSNSEIFEFVKRKNKDYKHKLLNHLRVRG